MADDKVQRRINRYLEGEITREVFFEQLTKYPEPSHQICFCTLNSLRMLKKTNYRPIIKIEDIGELIVEKLVIDFDFDEQTATDKFFSSNVFRELSDTKNKLYENDWIEIYNLLLIELRL